MQTQLTRQAIFDRLFAAFQLPQYRLVWAGNYLYYTGRIMNSLITGWFALELTDSAFWVGLIAAVDGLGSLLFGVLGGVLVDRFDRRAALLASQVISGVLLAGLGLLVVLGRVAPWHLLVIALVEGALNAIQSPAVGVVVYQVVDRQKLLNASASHMFSFTLARIGGAAFSGWVLAAGGAGPAYLLAAAIMGLSGLPLLFLRGVFRPATPPAAVLQAALGGLRHAWGNGPLRTLLCLGPLVETFAFSYHYMLPVVARDVLGVGPVGLGWLSSAGGVGSGLGVLVMASLGDTRHKTALLTAATAGAGVCLIFFALSRSYTLSLIAGGGIGFALVCYDVLMPTLIQLLTPDEVRGRIIGLYTLGFSFSAFGGLLAGAVAASAGAPLAIGAAGVAVLGLTAWAAPRVRRIRLAADQPAPAP
jgi:MFS family permease